MLIFFVLLIAVFSFVVLISLFAPEKLPWYRPHLILERREMEVIHTASEVQRPVILEGLLEPEEENVSRLEKILAEKNKAMQKLQKELAAEKKHRSEFEKIKNLLDEEIVHLRSQNRELKTQAERPYDEGETHA